LQRVPAGNLDRPTRPIVGGEFLRHGSDLIHCDHGIDEQIGARRSFG
jgi:hypothetical protein